MKQMMLEMGYDQEKRILGQIWIEKHGKLDRILEKKHCLTYSVVYCQNCPQVWFKIEHTSLQFFYRAK